MTDPVVTNVPEEQKKREGLNVCGYTVPWWVIVVVVCVLAYLAYDNEGLNVFAPKEVKLSGPSLVAPARYTELETPRDLRNFLRRY